MRPVLVVLLTPAPARRFRVGDWARVTCGAPGVHQVTEVFETGNGTGWLYRFPDRVGFYAEWRLEPASQPILSRIKSWFQ